MKKIFFAFAAIFTVAVEAQNISDVVRYSQPDRYGTARYRSMSGAFGALGGDLSALDINPAGSAVFLSSMATLTLDMENAENLVSFQRGRTTDSNADFDLGQGGAALVFYNQQGDWRKFTMAFNYSKTANFEDNFMARGRNTRSIDQYFLEYAQGVPLDLLELRQDETMSELYSYLGENEGFGAQQALLGYQGFIIDPVQPDNPDNTEYVTALGGGNFDQSYAYSATGLNGKFSFNFATQYQDFLYLGINLNSHFINYDRVVAFDETNGNTDSEVSSIYFEDKLSTLGSGFSLQLGALARIGNNIRAGLAYESPTWYDISEETTQYLETDAAVVDPSVINVYPDYKIQTPSRFTGSLAYLFGSRALLSFDYSYKDYSTMKFKPTSDPNFAFQNDQIEQQLQGASIFRFGGEYRIGGWSLRGGYRFEESPYVDGTTISALKGYSAGLGFDFGNVKLDLAYEMLEQDRNPRLFEVGLTDRYVVNRTNQNFVLSLSFGI